MSNYLEIIFFICSLWFFIGLIGSIGSNYEPEGLYKKLVFMSAYCGPFGLILGLIFILLCGYSYFVKAVIKG